MILTTHKDSGRYIPITFLLYCSGSLFGLHILQVLGCGSPEDDGKFKRSCHACSFLQMEQTTFSTASIKP